MAIGELDLSWTVFRPDEAKAERVVDPDGVLAFPVALKGLKPIGWRRPQIA